MIMRTNACVSCVKLVRDLMLGLTLAYLLERVLVCVLVFVLVGSHASDKKEQMQNRDETDGYSEEQEEENVGRNGDEV
eukprot:440744-Pleurochrysis_carterae.AAC.7